MEDQPSQKQNGVSTYDKWKLKQPGFMEMNSSSLLFAKWFLKKNREITWDGT